MRDNSISGCGWTLLLILVSPLMIAWNGYAASVLWRWFIAPTFGLPVLSVPAAIGVGLMVAHLTHRRGGDRNSDKTEGEKFLDSFAYAALSPALTLLIGWIVLKFA